MMKSNFRFSLRSLLAFCFLTVLPLAAFSASTVIVTVNSVVPNPTTVCNPAQYTISIDLASDGGLTGGSDTITILFPSGTQVDTGSISGVTVNGTTASSATGSSTSSGQIDVVPAQNLANGLTVTIVIPSTAINNPPTSGTYTLTVETSQQPTPGTSPNYSIAQSSATVVVTSVTPLPAFINELSRYTVNFNLASDGTLLGGTSTITLHFASDTGVPNGSISGITVEGVAASSAVGTTATRLITITPAQNLAGGFTGVTVVLPLGTLMNPSTAGTYTLTVLTSTQPNSGTCTYSILEPTATYTATPSRTITPTRTITPSHTPSPTVSPTRTITRTSTRTYTPTITRTATPTPTSTITATITPTITVTSTQTQTLTATPVDFYVAPDDVICYPSPASGNDCWFYYDAPSQSTIEIELFNVIGEKCKTITDEKTMAGFTRTHWDISGVAPGVYFYKLHIQTNGQTRHFKLKKMIIVKK